MTMIKSRFYYITGFSRPENTIELSFDFASDLHQQITENCSLEFSRSPEFILLHCRLSNITPAQYRQAAEKAMVTNGQIICTDSAIEYELQLPKDSLIPASVSQLNSFIMLAKSEICDFTERCYEHFLSE